MIAPQPFFEPRGAPLCVYQHIHALVASGYEVDLVTYPFGSPVDLPHLTIYRAPAPPFLRGVQPGFSLAKFPLDLLLFLAALYRLCRGKYRYIYTHEEAAGMGIVLALIFGCMHLYYMHCDFAQLVTGRRWLARCLQAYQAMMVRGAHVVIAFYPEVARTARKIAPGKPIYTIVPSAVDEDLPPAMKDDVARLRRQWKLSSGPVLLYTGTLESYQGIDILLQSVDAVRSVIPDVRYVIVGGKPEQIRELRALAEKLGAQQHVCFVGQRPREEMPYYMALASVLVSPRCQGTHTPLKLYTYLRSGKPILATDILSHTQVLTHAIAHLVPPDAQGLAQGALELLQHPERAEVLSASAKRLADEQYSWSVFLAKNREVYAALADGSFPPH
jgi:glycosyltransferase involved in cell wall biosynthesis